MRYIPEELQNLKGVNKLSEDELALQISTMSNFLQSRKSTYSGYMDFRKARKKQIEEMTEYKFKNEEDYSKFEIFMDEMYKRDKVMWKEHYDEAMELYTQGRRLNLDPMQFVRNYEYWLDIDKIEALSNAEPLDRAKLSPSDYARKLKLPKIRGGGNYGD